MFKISEMKLLNASHVFDWLIWKKVFQISPNFN